MTDLFALILAGAAGGLLGLLFFGGLWWTVRRAFDSARPALWVGGSLLLRMGCVAAGFVVVSAGDWRRSLSCLLGFWAARWLVLRLTTRLVAEPSAASRLSLESANGRSRVNSTLAQGRAPGGGSAGAMKCDGGDAQ